MFFVFELFYLFFVWFVSSNGNWHSPTLTGVDIITSAKARAGGVAHPTWVARLTHGHSALGGKLLSGALCEQSCTPTQRLLLGDERRYKVHIIR